MKQRISAWHTYAQVHWHHTHKRLVSAEIVQHPTEGLRVHCLCQKKKFWWAATADLMSIMIILSHD